MPHTQPFRSGSPEDHYVVAQAVFSAWAAMDLAAAKAALIERCLGVNSVEAHKARRRVAQLHRVLIAKLRTSPEGA
jgi:hypothetical protein